MSRFVAIYSNAGDRFAQGPYASRHKAAIAGAVAKSRDFELSVEVLPLVDRPVEVGHVPLGLNSDGEGPVPDEQAARFVCLECGCPAIAPPPMDGRDAFDRLAEDLRRAQSELPALRKRLRTD